MPNADIAARLADLEDRVLDRLDALELHNSSHCSRCMQAAQERAHHRHTSEILAEVKRANEERETRIRKLAEAPHVRVHPVKSFVQGKVRTVVDPRTGRAERTRFIVHCQEGPFFYEATETEWLALVADDSEVAAALAKGLLRVEPMPLADRIRFQSSRQRSL